MEQLPEQHKHVLRTILIVVALVILAGVATFLIRKNLSPRNHQLTEAEKQEIIDRMNKDREENPISEEERTRTIKQFIQDNNI